MKHIRKKKKIAFAKCFSHFHGSHIYLKHIQNHPDTAPNVQEINKGIESLNNIKHLRKLPANYETTTYNLLVVWV